MDNAERDSLIFYRSFAKAIKRLPEAEQLKALWAIVDYGLDGTEPEEEGLYMVAYDMAKPQIDANIKRKNDGKKGGRPSIKTSGYENEENIKTSGYENEKPNVNVNVNDNVLKENTLKGVKEKRFAPPTPENVRGYCREMGYANVDAERFVDFYAAKDWMIGKNRMKDWKAAVRNWARQDHSSAAGKQKKNAFLNFDDRGTDYDAMVAEEARRMIKDSGGGTDEQH